MLELTRLRDDAGIVFAVLDVFEDTPISEAFFRRYALRILDAVLSITAGVSFEPLAEHPSEYRAALVQIERFQRLPPSMQSELLELPERPAIR